MHRFKPLTTSLLVAVVALLFVANTFMVIDIALASTNISSNTTEHWAWNDIFGWIDFYNGGSSNVTVSSSQLTGSASSSVGYISLDCATSPAGDICGTSNYKVQNDGLGTLSGYGWNDAFGWISFSCLNGGTGCGISTYGVAISASTGAFSNYAWNDIAGWISFDCHDVGGQSFCDNVSNYKVKTSWTATSTTGILDSTTYDTGVSTGAQFNSIIWQGALPAGTQAQFQIASSDSSSGPWTYVGGDGTSATYYTGSSNTPIKLDTSAHVGKRYLRYRIFLLSNSSQTLTPRVDDVVIGWSP